MWITGISPNSTYQNDFIANSFRNSEGIVNARFNFYAHGVTTDRYDFGIEALMYAGFDPIEQFTGSYSYSIEVRGNNLQYTITNTTSFASFLYHLWPYEWNWNYGPMGDFQQQYIFTEPFKK